MVGERRSRVYLNPITTGENNMQLRAFVISVVIALLAVQSSASSTVSWQANPKGDVISGEWVAVITRPNRNVPITFKLKLEDDKVTGAYESSHLGNGTISNGSWENNKLKITIQSSHGALVLTATLQNDNLAGEWEANQMQGKWEAKKEARDDKRDGGDERE
jgi:cellulase/cellobiase CelA1